jgi:hypothetical protein
VDGVDDAEAADGVVSAPWEWLEDEFQPRTADLAKTVWRWTRTLRVADGHGERFRPDDLVRMGGENVLVERVEGDRLRVLRALGALRPRWRLVPHGADLVIVANLESGVDAARESRSYWRFRRWVYAWRRRNVLADRR